MRRPPPSVAAARVMAVRLMAVRLMAVRLMAVRLMVGAVAALCLTSCGLAPGGSGEDGLQTGELGADDYGSLARAGAPNTSTAPVPVGVAVKGSDPTLVAELVTSARAEPSIIRTFARWDSPFPSEGQKALLDQGYLMHLSVRPRTERGQVIPWAEIAAASDDSPLAAELRAWLVAAAVYDGQVYFTLNHEPETADSAPNGTAEEYVAAWRRMVELRADVDGGRLPRTVFVVGRGAYQNGEVDLFYPGDDVVDVVGVDAYNWYDCQGSVRAWIEPEALLQPALDFAAAHHKRLAVGEIGSTEDAVDPGRKPEWIRSLAQLLDRADVAPQLEFVAWFSVHDRAWPDCRWGYDSSSRSTAAFGELLRSNAG